MKFAAFVVLVSLRIMYQPSQAQHSAFVNPSVFEEPPAKLTQFKGHLIDKKVILQWQVEQNQSANLFEVEKCTDGRHFKTAGLVFGTDQPETGNYEFYEKSISKNISYRIKLINKDRNMQYSNIVVIRRS